MPEDFDLVILGGGTGSTVAAWTFASKGQRVAVVDRKYIGCPPKQRIWRGSRWLCSEYGRGPRA
jgi:pyruvate/2-oxoglutarate dehydrogenase complex dihydrolipoamide dehydrogenase (E3) component